MLQKRRPVCQFASGDSIGVSVLNCFIDSSFPAGQKLEGICLPVLRADKGCVLCATLESDQCLFFFSKGQVNQVCLLGHCPCTTPVLAYLLRTGTSAALAVAPVKGVGHPLWPVE